EGAGLDREAADRAIIDIPGCRLLFSSCSSRKTVAELDGENWPNAASIRWFAAALAQRRAQSIHGGNRCRLSCESRMRTRKAARRIPMQGAPGLTDRRIALAPVGPQIARAAQMPFKRSRPGPPNLTCCSG